MRLLFVKRALGWPRATGHDGHTYNTMKACAALGHEVSLAVATPPAAHALDGLTLQNLYRLDTFVGNGEPAVDATWAQLKFRSFFGVPDSVLKGLRHAAGAARAEAVIASGLDVLPYFAALSGVTRVWYAADELLWHHLSQLKARKSNILMLLREGLLQGAYERAHRKLIDHAWVVSPADKRAMRWFAGVRTVDLLALGVDGEFFAPGTEATMPQSATFWGRLDFGPNIQALEWFFAQVWPTVRASVPQATFTIIGYNPSEAVRRLATGNGVTLVPDLPDLRSAVRAHSLVVLPFVSGGGMKNKLLEAAAMGMPIACTPLAAAGLRLDAAAPLAIAASPKQLAAEIVALWRDEGRRQRLGAAARAWVLEGYTWTSTARQAVATIERSPAEGREKLWA